MTTKTIETCTDEEIAEALRLADALRARRDASAAWQRYLDSGKALGAKAFDAMVAERDGTDEAARGAAEKICDLVPKIAAHLAALKAAGAEVVEEWKEHEIGEVAGDVMDRLATLCGVEAAINDCDAPAFGGIEVQS
jgi:hypothetical protein